MLPEGHLSPDEVRAQIERARNQIAASALALRREVAAKTDWREYVRRRPLQFIVGALLVGWLLGNRRR